MNLSNLPINQTIERLETQLANDPTCERTQRLLKSARTIKANIIAKCAEVSAQHGAKR